MSDENLNEGEPRFELSDIFRLMREGVIVIGQDMRISACNEAAQINFGRISSSLISQRLAAVLRDIKLHKAFKKAITKRKSSEVRIELIDATPRIFDVLISPLDLNEQYSAIGVFYEVTKVERLERVRQEFLSNISHELRTPLTSIIAFVETLQEGGINDEANRMRFLEVIQSNASRMHHLIDDISELSSIEAGNVRIQVDTLDASELVSDVITNMSSIANERGIELLNEVPEQTLVIADAVRLTQMITNLVENAIKFNRNNGSVRISFEQDEHHFFLSVYDNGEGISKEHQIRIFERFYRIDKARSREVGGTGLGLAIVKHLARLHRGEISVSSVPGDGTTFTIRLPKRQEPAK